MSRVHFVSFRTICEEIGVGERPLPKKEEKGEEDTPVQEIAQQLLRCVQMADGCAPKDKVLFAAMDTVEKFYRDNKLVVEKEFMAKRVRTAVGESGVSSKVQRVSTLKEDVQNSLTRLHQTQVAQFASSVRQAQRAIAGGNFTSLLEGMSADELTEVLGSLTIGGNAMKTCFTNILTTVLKNEVAMITELQIQIRYVASMSVNTIELTIANEFTDPSGQISWINFTKKLGRLMRGEGMKD